MAFHLNAPRILADASHTASKLILITSIHRNKSAEGVSLLTQILYIAVFGTRYLDLFWVPPWWSWWNFVLKIFYIASSAYIVWLMMRCYARTREKEYAWKLATGGLAVSAVAAPVVCLTFRHWKGFGIAEVSCLLLSQISLILVLQADEIRSFGLSASSSNPSVSSRNSYFLGKRLSRPSSTVSTSSR